MERARVTVAREARVRVTRARSAARALEMVRCHGEVTSVTHPIRASTELARASTRPIASYRRV